MTEPVVLTTVARGVGVITLNRPDRRNALHADMYPIIKSTLERWDTDDAVGCIVLTGAGSGFCAGGDVRNGGRRNTRKSPPSIEESTSTLLEDARTAQMLHESTKITLGAINGPAVGAGMALALACDLRIMAASAKLVPGYSRLAFSGDFGGTWFLTRLLGPAKALEILAANTVIDGATAAQWDMINRVVPDDDFDVAWRTWAQELADGPTQALQLMKANVRDAEQASLDEALPRETERMVRSSRTADHKEAVKAWLDKREPTFRRGEEQ